jgi:hypothetical protein
MGKNKYIRAERDGRKSALEEKTEMYKKHAKIPVELKQIAKEQGLCVQDLITIILLQ